ncbi:MAG: hypothetical protein MUE48_04295 [Desulfobacterales bacterium]|jgi:hypothetical protein|nr:hypothetical protein [Desulfobacterales bacterium]
MKNRMRSMGLAICLLVSWAAAAGAAEGQAPAEGGLLPKIVLAAPKDPAQVAYLGLGSKAEFTVADIPAEVVVVHIFNMY